MTSPRRPGEIIPVPRPNRPTISCSTICRTIFHHRNAPRGRHGRAWARDQRAGLVEADGEAVRDALAGVEIDDGGGGWLPTTSAMGTMVAARNNVTTNDEAPHSATWKVRVTAR